MWTSVTARARAATLRLARRYLPILGWLPSYSAADAVGDVIAGFTVGLTLIPQGIAYAALAGLPPQYGLYSALPGGLVYAVLGTCMEISVQLTALVALLTAAYTLHGGPDVAVLLCFLSGIVQLLCGFLRLGFLVDFVSAPVVQGFTAAAAITIASSQLKGMLGLTFESQGFLDTWRQLFQHIPNTRLADTLLSVSCIVTLLALRSLKDVKVQVKKAEEKAVEEEKTAYQGQGLEEDRDDGGGGGGGGGGRSALDVEEAESREAPGSDWREVVARQGLWLMATSRNALVVLLAAGITAGMAAYGHMPFLLSGSVEPGLPSVRPPPFETTWENRTLSFAEMCEHLGSGIAVVPIISILGNIAIAKAFARGRVVDASQEMVALGMCNIVASFFRSAPVAGSFTCSAVSKASGVRTPLSAAYTATLVALSLALLTQYFTFIPKAALAAVVVSAVIFMVDLRSIVPMWNTSRWDLLPLGATFTASLALGVAPGLLAGVAVDVALLLFFTARPRITARTLQWDGACGGNYVQVTPAGGLNFPCVDHVRGTVVHALAEAVATEGARPSAVVLDLAHAARVDYSAALGLASLAAERRRAERFGCGGGGVARGAGQRLA